MENASACLHFHKLPLFQILALNSCTTKQLHKLSAKVLEKWTKGAKYTLFETNNHTVLNKNVIFCLFCFRQVVQKQTFGEVEK